MNGMNVMGEYQKQNIEKETLFSVQEIERNILSSIEEVLQEVVELKQQVIVLPSSKNNAK